MVPKIDAGVCERLINAATAHCSTAATPVYQMPPQIVHEPNWEGVTTALTSMSNTLTLGLFILAIFGFVGLVPFVIFVRIWAQNEARKAAREWFDTEAPAILKTLNQPPTTPDDGNVSGPSTPTANTIAEAAG